MKIITNKITKENLDGYVTETNYVQIIEADARELRESNTLADIFTMAELERSIAV